MEGERRRLLVGDDGGEENGRREGGRGVGRWISRNCCSGRTLVLACSIFIALFVGALHLLPQDASHQTFSRSNGKAAGQQLKHAVHAHARAPRSSTISSSMLSKIPSDMRAFINASADPCTDFYEFSCGQWLEETSIPSWQSSWAKQWDGVTTDVEQETVKALQKDAGPAGTFFRSCMDTATIQKLGNAPLKPWMNGVELVKDHASFMQSLANFALSDMTVFFGWWVDADSIDSSINSFFIAQGGITMPDRSYYIDPSKSMAKKRLAFKTMVLNIMQLSGRIRSEAVEDANNVMELETAIARAMKDNTAERDEHGERMRVSELEQLVPSIDWKSWLKMLGCPDVGSGKGSHLIVKNKEFLTKVGELMKTSSYDKIRSYLRWQAVYSFAPYLSFPFEDELVRYNNEIYGISKLPPRWRKCFFSTGEAMDMHVSRVFVNNYFPESSRRHALDMLMQIREQFNQTLQKKEWMDEAARVKAVYKLQHMFLEVGHPSVWPPSAFQDFKSFGGIRDNTYFDNIVATNAFDVQNALSRLGKKVDRRRWGSSSATDVNSYYSRKVNGIFIPAGILQPPFYSPTQAMARNYGSVGSICGHEMTHGFDDIGTSCLLAGCS